MAGPRSAFIIVVMALEKALAAAGFKFGRRLIQFRVRVFPSTLSILRTALALFS